MTYKCLRKSQKCELADESGECPMIGSCIYESRTFRSSRGSAAPAPIELSGADEKLPAAIYLSGPMTGKPDYGRADFRTARKRLEAQGFSVIDPGILPVLLAPDRYMPICFAMVDAADAVYMLHGWRDSKGAKLERAYAIYQGKKILYEEETQSGGKDGAGSAGDGALQMGHGSGDDHAGGNGGAAKGNM